MADSRIYNLPNKAYNGALRVPVDKEGDTTGSIELSALQCGAMMGVPDWNKITTIKESGVDYTSGFKMEADGWIRTNLQTHDLATVTSSVSVAINGNGGSEHGIYVLDGGDTKVSDDQMQLVPVSKGDVVTLIYGGDDLRKYLSIDFIPYKKIQIAVNAPYVVERKRGTNTDGSTWWYTLWSDKWCEQGGKATIDVIFKETDPSRSISLQKAMEKDTLSIQLTAATTPAGHTPCSMYGFAKSSTTIWVTFDHVGGDEIVVPTTVPFFWHAEGYVA